MENTGPVTWNTHTGISDGRTTENSKDFANPLDIGHIRVIIILCYCFVFACCFFGNLLVIFVVLKHRRMRTITNFFLTNLAVADFCVGVFCVLPNLSTQISAEWFLGKVMCKLHYYVQRLSYQASITILTIMSAERYIAIVHPMRSKRITTPWRLKIVMMIVWLGTASISVPPTILYDTIITVDNVNNATHAYCVPVHHFNMRAYVTIDFVLWYFIPLLLMSVLYIHISTVLWLTSQSESARYDQKKCRSYVKSASAREDKQGLELMPLKQTNVDKSGRVAVSPNTFAPVRIRGYDAKHFPLVIEIAEGKSENVRFCDGSNPSDLSYGATNAEITDAEGFELVADYENDWPQSEDDKSAIEKQAEVDKIEEKRNQNIPTEMDNDVVFTQPKGQSTDARQTVLNATVTKKDATCTWHKALRARRKVVRLLISVIAAFALCVLPYHVRILWQQWSSDPDPEQLHHAILSPVTFLLLYFNSGLNPFLYALLSDNFRKSTKEVFCGVARVNSPTTVSSKITQSNSGMAN